MYHLGGPEHGASRDDSEWLRIGDEYPVLAMLAHAAPEHPYRTSVLVQDAAGSASWFPNDFFVTTSTRVPSNWIAEIDQDGALHIAPERWLEPGFWEARYDNQTDAIAVYRAELEVILSEL